MLQTLVYAESSSRGRPYFGYSFGYGAKIVCKLTFGPVSVSANVVSAKFPLRAQMGSGFGMTP